MSKQLVHRWEKAGLGKAPFQFIGWRDSFYQACPGAPVQPGSSCCYCATGISRQFHVRSADGKQFFVGSTCIDKVNEKGSKLVSDVDRVRNKIKSQQAHLRAQERTIEALEWMLNKNLRTHLDRLHHPLVWRSDNGDTLLDWACWMMNNSGNAGRVRVHRTLKKIRTENPAVTQGDDVECEDIEWLIDHTKKQMEVFKKEIMSPMVLAKCKTQTERSSK